MNHCNSSDNACFSKGFKILRSVLYGSCNSDIDVCPYGDLIYNTDYSNYADTYKRISDLLVKYGYRVCGWKGTIFKEIGTDKYDTVGEIR